MNNIAVNIDEFGVALLELNRPDVFNCLNTESITEVINTLRELSGDHSVKVLLLTGKGSAFCAGADLGALAEDSAVILSGDNGTMGDYIAETMRTHFNEMTELLYRFPKPVVSAINGVAAGGGAGLALCADIALASDDAYLKVVQVAQLGIAADLGANWLMARLAGRGRALGACLLGESISASQLKDWGLIWQSYPKEELMQSAHNIARKLAKTSVGAALATRQLIDAASNESFSELLERERITQQRLFDTPDVRKTLTALIAAKN